MLNSSAIQERSSRIDWLMLAALIGLMCLGAAFIYSATSADDPLGVWGHFKESGWIDFFGWLYQQTWFRQILWYGIGLTAAAVVCFVDYHILCRWAMVFYLMAVLLLVAVLVFGATRYGAKRWIDLGLFQFQPSEFAKLAFIFVLAHFLSRPHEELLEWNVFVKAIGLMALPFLLIMIEPDLGSALVFIPVGFTMMYVSGLSPKYLRRLVAGAALFVAIVVANVLFAPPQYQINLEEYQRQRLLVYFGFEESYNVRQSMISVGTGGLTGKGWQEGKQYALGFLPKGVAHNDFIFSVIAEESGFLGSSIVLTLYSVILFCGIRIAGQARDRLGKLLAVGVVALLFSHVFVNIGMNIRIMPVTGIPLPLLSAGGSSVLSSLIAAGILQNVSIHRKVY